MDLNKFTIKAQEAIQQAQEVAQSLQHQTIETSHIMKAMLMEDESVVEYLLKKLDVNVNQLREKLDDLINKLPKVTGSDQLYLSQDVNKVFSNAKGYLSEFKDEFVSVEHLLLALLNINDEVSKILKDWGVTEKGLRTAITDIRKGATVKDQGAESTYNALSKYSNDLNQMAKDGKLDPVIGRDEEIRRVLHVL
ncbi:MAG: type VI secretion system ATPase TssH, partial [Bacteroidetes bacterium]|nr:type VI secretion system ATPase TssH [Bacteroidota bacterium]